MAGCSGAHLQRGSLGEPAEPLSSACRGSRRVVPAGSRQLYRPGGGTGSISATPAELVSLRAAMRDALARTPVCDSLGLSRALERRI